MKYEEITKFILQERKRQKITKEDMAGILFISPTTIYQEFVKKYVKISIKKIGELKR
jgi:DNA-binding XRE family transcriptional regulator